MCLRIYPELVCLPDLFSAITTLIVRINLWSATRSSPTFDIRYGFFPQARSLSSQKLLTNRMFWKVNKTNDSETFILSVDKLKNMSIEKCFLFRMFWKYEKKIQRKKIVKTISNCLIIIRKKNRGYFFLLKIFWNALKKNFIPGGRYLSGLATVADARCYTFFPATFF